MDPEKYYPMLEAKTFHLKNTNRQWFTDVPIAKQFDVLAALVDADRQMLLSGKTNEATVPRQPAPYDPEVGLEQYLRKLYPDITPAELAYSKSYLRARMRGEPALPESPMPPPPYLPDWEPSAPIEFAPRPSPFSSGPNMWNPFRPSYTITPYGYGTEIRGSNGSVITCTPVGKSQICR